MRFLYMYTREAHSNPDNAPCGSTEDLGWTHPSSETTSVEQRAQRVRWLKDQFALDFEFLVDDMDNTVRNAYYPGGFYMAWIIDCNGRVVAFEPWAWATQDTQWCGLPLPDMSRLENALDAYLASPPSCYRGIREPAFSVVVPTVAHLSGLGGSLWTSSLALANPSPTAVTAELTLLLRTSAKEASSLRRTVTLEAGATLVVDDVVPDLFSTTGIGALRIDADRELAVHSRALNDRGDGSSVGQVIPPIRSQQAVTEGRAGHLLHLEESARARTNLNLVNLEGGPTEVEVAVFAADGPEIGRRSIVVHGHDLAQLNQLVRRFGASDEVGARAEVRCLTTGCRVVASASVVDNQSGDARFIAPTINTWAVESRAAWLAGGPDAGTSELYVYNHRLEPTTAILRARSARDNLELDQIEVELPPRTATVINDPLASFDLTSATATLVVQGKHSKGLVASTRLSRDEGIDLTVPAVDVTGDGVLRFDRRAHLLDLEQSAERSTDLLLVNTRPNLTDVELRFFSSDGAEIGRLTHQVGGWGVLEIDDVLSRIEADGGAGVRCEVTTDGRLLVAATIHEHSSGDVFYQPAWVELDI